METITELHDRAMEYTDNAYFANKRGDPLAELDFNKQALDLEIKAVEMLRDRYDMEPSRSILYRSATRMAYACNEMERAEQLVHFGLSGNPERSVKDELQDLLDQIAFDRQYETAV